MAKTFFKVEGLADCEQAFEDLSRGMVRGVLLRGLRRIAQPVADTESALAPKGVTGKLSESPTVGTKLSKRQKKLNRKESDVEIYVGPTPHAKSVQTEFGNAHQAPQPHLRPAVDQHIGSSGGSALKDFVKFIQEETEKSLVRARRKAAKIAASFKS